MLALRVTVPVTTVWVSPDSPRPVDAAAVADEPDAQTWLSALDAGTARQGLNGRVQTQLVRGEPAVAVGPPDAYPGWVEVVCPWQPSSRDPRGYPGWVRRAHLAPASGPLEPPPAGETAQAGADLRLAREYLGLPYLWGGTSSFGLDCSGLVHLVHRRLGRTVPRDAHDQQAGTERLDVRDVRPGDLYFFAAPGAPAHHVGIVTAPGRMIHAAGSRCVVEEALEDRLRETLSGAGRIPERGQER